MSTDATDRRPISDAIAPGLDLFVAAWAEEWTKHGGWISLQGQMWLPPGKGGVTIGYQPDYGQVNGDLSEPEQGDQQLFNFAHHCGRMKSMIDVINAVPHARDALAAHLRSHGVEDYRQGAR